MPTNTSRRNFFSICAAGLAAPSFLSKHSLGNSTTALAPTVRRDIRNLAKETKELELYKIAFRRLWDRWPLKDWHIPENRPSKEQMKTLDRTKRTSLVFQALLHTHYCPHNNWWFFPWHRAYLYYFEKLLQDAVRDLNPSRLPTIPYWNWTDDRPSDHPVPKIFRGTLSENPLGNNRRHSNHLLDSHVGKDVIRERVNNAHSFEVFGSGSVKNLRDEGSASPFERGPHLFVHMLIGGADRNFRPGDFNHFATAAFDPIFWSHHANVDRLWNQWLSFADHSNPKDRTWHEMHFDMFVDAQGNHLSKTVAQVMADPEIRSVIYAPDQRDSQPPSPFFSLGGTEALGRMPRGEIKINVGHGTFSLNRGVTLHIPLSVEQRQLLTKIASVTSEHESGEAILILNGIRMDPKLPDLYLNCFLSASDAAFPNRRENFIGSFGFNANRHDGHSGNSQHGYGQIVDLTSALRRLKQLKRLKIGNQLSVTFVLLPLNNISRAHQPPGNLQVPFQRAELQIKY